jgi:glycyl-tRNA synthetase beta chain
MIETKDFLLEIGCEEMPSSPLIHATKQLGELIASGLGEAGISHGKLRVISSPRRLAVLVFGVGTRTREVHETKRGPAASIAFDSDGNPTKAACGFARKNGIKPDRLVRHDDADGKEYVFAEKNIPAKPAMPILSDLCEAVIAGLEWPNYRSQRWGSEHVSFVRPIRWICALFGHDVIPVTYGDVQSSNFTFGHRVLGKGARVVSEPSVYEKVLEDAHVLSAEKRAKVIRAGIAKVEEERGGAHVDTPKRTFEEVVNLCEWPTVLVGKFDEEFLAVPHEIICESMLTNQRYFPIYDAHGDLTREFVIVGNGDPRYSATIVDGNERVIRARLDDAKFFYQEDLKVPMDDFVERLDKVIFQERLGTVRQKTARLETIASDIANQAGASAVEVEHTARAAHLAKADLVSQTVVEFTNQQGVMGGYFAQAAGEPDDVAEAIRDHYRPRFAGDALPGGFVGKCVALADKIDTICGMFAIGEPPTGSADPFAVRRAAIGVIAILRTLPEVSLPKLIEFSLATLTGQGINFDAEAVSADIRRFFASRLATIAKGEHISPDTIAAVSAVGVIDPAEFLARAHALEDARAQRPEIFEDLAAAYTRAAHLADSSLGTEINEAILGDAERALLKACTSGQENVKMALTKGDYAGACDALADLKEPIDRFFDDVLVMDEDTGLRENRLRLLNRFASVFTDVADIGALSRKK